jgi:hypothetical protein
MAKKTPRLNLDVILKIMQTAVLVLDVTHRWGWW